MYITTKYISGLESNIGNHSTLKIFLHMYVDCKVYDTSDCKEDLFHYKYYVCMSAHVACYFMHMCCTLLKCTYVV